MPDRVDIVAGKVWKLVKRPGKGAKPGRGQKVTVHYKLTLEGGSAVIDSSEGGEPFSFKIGGEVIQGWNVALPTMQVGEVAEVHIHSDYGYGNDGDPPDIPPKATLQFIIELLSIG